MNNLLPQDGEVYYIADFLDKEERQTYFEILQKEIRWERDVVTIYGRKYITDREVAWYADDGLVYRYSGSVKYPEKWNGILLELKQRIEDFTGEKFNACLLNLYHNGNEGMGWHSDDEPELGKTPSIASLSLGADRKFSFKHKTADIKTAIQLENGSLLMMRGQTQHYWKHCLPKSKRVEEARINLTFRKIGQGR